MTINFYADFFCDGRSYLSRKRSDAVQTEQREGFMANKSRWDFSPRGLGKPQQAASGGNESDRSHALLATLAKPPKSPVSATALPLLIG